jgi:malate/lactate dehydrogenase
MQLNRELKDLTQRWRSGAAGIRERYRGMGAIAGSALATADTMEECASVLEKLLAEDGGQRTEDGGRTTEADACGIGGPS